MNKQEVKNFFKEIHQGDNINFRCIKTGNKPIDCNGVFDDRIVSILLQANKQDFEIYFVVNSGGYKDKDIIKFNAVFIDLDCGRDEDGDYFSPVIVNDFKYSKWIEIQEFDLSPTYIVETRNGYHVYWLLHEGASKEEFNLCESRLIEKFGADKAVKNPARLMRVPEFYWCKDKSNKFLVNIRQHENIRYNINDIITALPSAKDEGKGKSDTHNKKCKTFFITDGAEIPTHSNKDLIVNKDILGLQAELNPKEIELDDNEKVYDYLKKQSLCDFLGLYDYNFNCIFHDDKTPSAGIIKNKATGHYIYNCLSGSCNVSYNIIQVTKALTNMNIGDCLNFLRKVYKIQYKESEWKHQKLTSLEQNQKDILSLEFGEKYKQLNNFVTRYSDLLILLHEISSTHIYTKYFTDRLGNPVFFVSTRELARRLGKDFKTVSQRISILAYLGLIRKLPECEIPNEMLERAKQIAKQNKHSRITSYYSIPIYSEKTLKFSQKKAYEYKELNFSVNGFSRELLYRTLGEEEANRVYPQMKGNTLSDISQEHSTKIEQVILGLIEDKGWTTELEVICYLCNLSGSKKYNEKILKRKLPEILDKYDLVKKRLNNPIKEQLGIDLKGYPYIIVKASI